ncbi:hypothetical protein Slin15195_G130110 [Septoria linicola]|uniref:Uncharacterized protein n=1 Tax=Septoria linicola TaxID=215465 RepID=A0A9Q9B0X5_9PEZI|nr:hypothetical protein Slin15195_G130110 [Septoria linicola]
MAASAATRHMAARRRSATIHLISLLITVLLYVTAMMSASFAIVVADEMVMDAVMPAAPAAQAAFDAAYEAMAHSIEATFVRVAPTPQTGGTLRAVYCNAALTRDMLYDEKTWRAVEGTISSSLSSSSATLVASRCARNATALERAQAEMIGRGMGRGRGGGDDDTAAARRLTLIMHNALDGLARWEQGRVVHVLDETHAHVTELADSVGTLGPKPRRVLPIDNIDAMLAHVPSSTAIALQLYLAVRHALHRALPLSGWLTAYLAHDARHDHARHVLSDVLDASPVAPFLTAYMTARNSSSSSCPHTDLTLQTLAAQWTPTGHVRADTIFSHGIQHPLSHCRAQQTCLPADAAQHVLATFDAAMEPVRIAKQNWIMAGAPVGRWSPTTQKRWRSKMAELERHSVRGA